MEQQNSAPAAVEAAGGGASATQAAVAAPLPAGEGAKKAATAGAPEASTSAAPTADPATPAVALPPGVPAPSTEIINIDDFLKIDLRVAQVKVAEKVKGADKLLRLEVDLGYETRQIVAGIALTYSPEQLVGRKIVIIANLAPRKLRGLESQGMLLAASLQDGAPVLASFLEEVPVGAKLK